MADEEAEGSLAAQLPSYMTIRFDADTCEIVIDPGPFDIWQTHSILWSCARAIEDRLPDPSVTWDGDTEFVLGAEEEDE